MNKNKFNLKFGIIALMVALAAASRFMPHPPNFTPVGGMALFGAAYFAKKYWAYIIPFLALWFSDLILNNVVYAEYQEGFTLFSSSTLWVYSSFALIVFLGSTVLKKITLPKVIGTSVAASLIFFLITNFGAWFADPFNMFADDLSGLVVSLEMGLPFFWNTLAGDLVYVGVLFGSYELVKNAYPTLAMKRA